MKLNSKQMEVLYECWLGGTNAKEWIQLISQRLPTINALSALSMIRKMSKKDPKWIQASIKKQEDKEKKKLALKEEKEKKKNERVQKAINREESAKQNEKLNKIKENLLPSDVPKLKELIKEEFFFCGNVDCFMNNISCIYKNFSHEFDGLIHGECIGCNKMDKYLETIEKIIKEK